MESVQRLSIRINSAPPKLSNADFPLFQASMRNGASTLAIAWLLVFGSRSAPGQEASEPKPPVIYHQDYDQTYLRNQIFVAASARKTLSISRGLRPGRIGLETLLPRGVGQEDTDNGRFPYLALSRSYGDRTAILFYTPSDRSFYNFDPTLDDGDLIEASLITSRDPTGTPWHWSFRASALASAAASLAELIYAPGSRDTRGIETANQAARISEPQALERAISRVGSLLLPPYLEPEMAPIDELIVVPSGLIGAIPFALLKPFSDRKFLIDRMSISIAPSIFDLMDSPKSLDFAFTRPLIVGNPHLPDPWAALPGSEREAKDIAYRFHVTPLLRDAASLPEIRKKAPQADLLYFATHGTAGGLSGSLVFGDGEGRVAESWSAREIQNLRFSARLAVLSACETGVGVQNEGGTIGLARAFQIAGVPRVVMSLWRIDDDSTAEFMKVFMDNGRKMQPARALQGAIISTREHFPAPSAWAGFALFGLP
jgi:hypothetical protein